MRQLSILFVTFTVAFASTINKNEVQSTKLDQKVDSILLYNEDNSSDLEAHLSESLKSSNFSIELPTLGSVTMDARNLDNEELNLNFNFGKSESGVEARKKSKIKKILVPILVFILLKALVLVPLALGILGIKTWNAIQLSFISFVSALALAIWKLCSKVHDHPPPIIHNAWDPYHHDRSDNAQQMAYSNYAPS